MITSERVAGMHLRFICDACHNVVGKGYPNNTDWRYCPFCAAPLYPEGLNREQRIAYIDQLYRGEK